MYCLFWFSVYGLDPEVQKSKLEILRFKLAEVGIELDHFAPGQYNALTCPMVTLYLCMLLLVALLNFSCQGVVYKI